MDDRGGALLVKIDLPILPCPFCGRSDLLGVEPVAERGFLAVKCRACGAVGPGGRSNLDDPIAEREAVEQWNRRPA